jgi:hypothetical protein
MQRLGRCSLIERKKKVTYSGDSWNIWLAYNSSRYLAELLAVCPRFHFVGDLHLSDSEHPSIYYITTAPAPPKAVTLDASLIHR